jgi:hypothetical protein
LAQMAFAEHHDMIEAFPADRADQTFDKPCQFQRRRRSGNDRQDVEALSANSAALVELLSRDADRGFLGDGDERTIERCCRRRRPDLETDGAKLRRDQEDSRPAGHTIERGDIEQQIIGHVAHRPSISLKFAAGAAAFA